MEADALGESVARGILRGESEGISGKIDGMNFGGGKFEGDGECNDAAARADVENLRRCFAFDDFQRNLDELLCLGAGDESTFVAGETAPVEFGRAENVLQRFASAAAFDRIAQRRAFGFG